MLLLSNPIYYLTIKTLFCQDIIDKIFKMCYVRVTIRNIPSSYITLLVLVFGTSSSAISRVSSILWNISSRASEISSKYYQPHPVLAMSVP
jgi:hypothetical protein